MTNNWEFVDRENQRFFMRAEIHGNVDKSALTQALLDRLPEGADIRLPGNTSPRMLILATKEAHCLGDLLIRCTYGEMNAEIPAVISNHPDLEPLVKGFDVPYHCISAEGLSRDGGGPEHAGPRPFVPLP